MYRFCPIVLVYAIVLFSVLTSIGNAAVVITPASGVCLNNTPGAFSTIGSITIQEGLMTDFSVQTSATLILSAPSGFEFLAASGSVSYTAGRNITSAGVVITATTITVTYTVTGVNRADRLVISGLQARGLIAGSNGNILRTGGTANIAGDATGGGVNHGSLSSNGTGISVNSVADGNWSTPATWSTGIVPSCGQDIIINNTVTADVATSATNLTITTGGNLIAANAVSVTTDFIMTGSGTYTHSNTADAASTIFAGTENFSSGSKLIINNWYNLNIPLGSLVSGNFGEITFNVAGTWQQDGYFAPARILGAININAGTIVMDDGTGMTTALSLQDVMITGTGNLTVCSGANRDLTFTTGNFTDVGTDATLSSVMLSCSGIVNWTANGSITLDDNFSLASNCGSPAGITLNVTGNLDITGGNINFLTNTNSPFTLSVGGRTGIFGNAGLVNFVNSGSGAFNYTTGSLELTAPGTFNLLSGSFSGTNLFTITNNFEVTGPGTSLCLINNSGYASPLNLTTSGNIVVTDASLIIANSMGTVNMLAGQHLTIAGSTSEFIGQENVSNGSLVDITVNGTLSITDATFYHTQGEGDIVLTVGEALVIDGANFYGLSHTTAPADASAIFNFQDFIFNGGTARFFTMKTSAPTNVTVNCSNNFEITWESNNDLVELLSYDGNNDASLDFTVGGNFTVSGNYANAYFLSSKAGGDETVSITGNFSVSGGKVFFVCDNTSTNGVDAHDIITTIGGNLEISGGTTFLSARDGSAVVNVGGDMLISSGIVNLKWLDGVAILYVDGGYTQTGGTFNIHSHTASTDDTCKVTVNGSFAQSAGIFNFDNAAGTGMAEHTLTLNGPAFTIEGSAVITHANNLTTSYVFGQVYFARAGTTVYSRISATHNIEHVKQTIQTGTTVNASASTYGFQMTSMASSNATIHNALSINGTLDMGDKIVSARQQTNYYSRLSVNAGGRYRTSHTGGFYSGSNVIPSSVNGYILTLNRAWYYLAPTSVVEYYGTNTSVVTGVPNGIATGASQQYGILEINFTGTAGSTWVYPETTEEVRIRTSLVLTAGEFNLDNDHVTTNGGRAINLEAGATTSRTIGFIRSETEDGSGVVKWNITTNSTNTIPFGYDASNYIPFTYQQTSSSAGIVQVGTYRTLVYNTPYPPTVTHTRDVNGFENSLETVDRFWKIAVPGTATANLVFTYTPSEGGAIVSPRAQLWEPVTMGWFPPSGVQSNPSFNSTSAGGISSFNTWWTLSALASPLPIELATFEIQKEGDEILINWSTQTEINNDFFTVERSADGNYFEPISQVDGAGNSSNLLHYESRDEHPRKGINYYRLKQTDFDGNYTYSEIKSVNFRETGSYSVYPNPLPAGSDLTIEVPQEGDYEIKILDTQGRTVFTATLTSVDGEFLKIPIHRSTISEGIYGLIITGQDTGFSGKILVKK